MTENGPTNSAMSWKMDVNGPKRPKRPENAQKWTLNDRKWTKNDRKWTNKLCK